MHPADVETINRHIVKMVAESGQLFSKDVPISVQFSASEGEAFFQVHSLPKQLFFRYKQLSVPEWSPESRFYAVFDPFDGKKPALGPFTLDSLLKEIIVPSIQTAISTVVTFQNILAGKVAAPG